MVPQYTMVQIHGDIFILPRNHEVSGMSVKSEVNNKVH